jgi:hypothetical protein
MAAQLTYGTALKGSERLFKAFIALFEARFSPLQPIHKENLVTGSGVGSLMDQLTAMCCDEGDGVLTAAPYYSGKYKPAPWRSSSVTRLHEGRGMSQPLCDCASRRSALPGRNSGTPGSFRGQDAGAWHSEASRHNPMRESGFAQNSNELSGGPQNPHNRQF